MMNSGIMVYHHLFSGSFSTNLQRNYPLFHQEFQKKRTFSNPLPPRKQTRGSTYHPFSVRLCWLGGAQLAAWMSKVKFIFSFWRPNCEAGRRMALLFPNVPRFFCRIITSTNACSKRENNTQKQTDTFGDGKCSWMCYTQEQNCSIANGAI